MQFATIHRMARPWGVEGRPFHRCRVAIGIFAICGALYLLTPNHALAQSEVEAVDASEIIPVQAIPGETIVSVNGSDDNIHEIVVGDTLISVARHYDVEPADLAVYNQILDYNHVVIGQKLRIPPVGVTVTEPAQAIQQAVPGADGYHAVRIGDALGAIARKYNVPMDVLMALNDITDPNTIQPGQMLRLRDDIEPPSNTIQPELDEILYEIEKGDTLSTIAEAYHTTIEQILADNTLTDENVEMGQELRILPPTDAVEAFGIEAPIDGERRIVIDLSAQELRAFQGNVLVLHSIVSTGKAATPTRPGEYAIYLKYKSQEMSGEDYTLPGVPWVMYYDDEYAMHGAYWHANFGIPTSHGCTNMTIPEAKALYSWAPLGTPVSVQE